VKRLFVLTPEATNDLRDHLVDIADDNPDTAEFEILEAGRRLNEGGHNSPVYWRIAGRRRI
jgi:hypothetical protein